MEKTEPVKKWKERLTVANRRFKSEFEKEANLFLRYFENDQWEGAATNTAEDRVTVNYIWSNTKVLIPSLNLRNPRINVTPKRPPFTEPETGQQVDTIRSAALLEQVMNFYWKELLIKKQTRLCLLDALIMPLGVMKVGYSLEIEQMIDGENTIPNLAIKKDMPYAIRWNPFDVRIDPEATTIDERRWVAFRSYYRLDDLKKNPLCSNLKGLKENKRVKTQFGEGSIMDDIDDRELEKEGGEWGRVEVWEVWDRRTNEFFWMVEDHDKFIREPAENPYDFDDPASFLIFNESPNRVYGIPDPRPLKDSQDVINRVESMHLTHIKRFFRKYLYHKGKIEDKDIEILKIPSDGICIGIDGEPTGAIIPLQDAPLSIDAYNLRAHAIDNIMRISSIADFERGVAEKVDTATEILQLASHSNSRKEERRDILETFLTEIAYKLSKIMQKVFTEQSITIEDSSTIMKRGVRLEEIIGMDSIPYIMPWINIKNRDIRGDFMFQIEVGSTMPTNRMQSQQQAVALYGLLKNDIYIDQYELRKDLLTAFEKQNIDKLLLTRDTVKSVADSLSGAGAEMGGMGGMGGGTPGASRIPPAPPSRVSPPTGSATGAGIPSAMGRLLG